MIGWLLVVRPLGDSLSRARERHGAAIVVLAEARAQAAEIERLQKQAPPRSSEPLASLVSRAASGAGFPVRSLTDAGEGGVRLVLESAAPQAFFAWVAQMEAQGLVVVQLTARPNQDRSLAAEVTFRTRSN